MPAQRDEAIAVAVARLLQKFGGREREVISSFPEGGRAGSCD